MENGKPIGSKIQYKFKNVLKQMNPIKKIKLYLFPLGVLNASLDLLGISSVMFIILSFLGVYSGKASYFLQSHNLSSKEVSYLLVVFLLIKLLINNLTIAFQSRNPLLLAKKIFLERFNLQANDIHNLEKIRSLNRELIEITVNITNSLFTIYGELTVIFISVIFVMYYYPKTILFIAFVILIIFLTLAFLIKKKMTQLSKSYIGSNQKRFDFIDECSKSFAEIHFYKLNNIISEKFHYLWDSTIIPYKKFLFVKNIYKYYVEFFFSIMIVVSFMLFGNDIKTGLNSKDIILLVLLIRILPSIGRIQPSLATYYYYLNHFRDLSYSTSEKTETLHSISSQKFAIRINNCNVILDKKKVLDEINLNFNIGESYLITGASGSGKTTLIKLIVGLINPTSGIVTYNKKYVHESSLLCSYVSQHPVIFDDTVHNNITLFRKIDEKKLQESIKVCGLEADLESKAVNLSGGEKKRLSIARAIAYSAPICILDEVDSGLDSESTNIIYEKIRNLYSDRLLIVISHKRLHGFSHTIKVKNGSIV